MRLVGNSRQAERPLAFGAFVAAAAVQTTPGGKAREAQLQRQMAPAPDDLRFYQASKRRDNLQPMAERFARSAGKIMEELRRGVGERIVPERADGDCADAMCGAEGGGLRKQQEIATGQVHSPVGSFRVWDPAARDAPVRAVEIADGKTKNGQWFMVDGGYGAQETA